jgi:polysaccharide deacetylase family protein (PEP-CTERM system associated)
MHNHDTCTTGIDFDAGKSIFQIDAHASLQDPPPKYETAGIMTECYLTFDIEDWFHSPNLQLGLDRDLWDTYELRVQKTTRKILEQLETYNIEATFFILGHVAKRAPDLVEEIDSQGHEIASHGYNHELLYEQSPEEIRNDISRSQDMLQSLASQPIRGYRAPCFSITEEAVDILAELGFEYDSSLFRAPVHDRYGSVQTIDARTFTETRNGFNEVQLPLLNIPFTRLPWAGGGYFRVIPYRLFRQGIRRILRHRDFVFYCHPWEIDPEQPQVTDIPLQYRIRHYTNLNRTEKRLEKLFNDFEWKPIKKGM